MVIHDKINVGYEFSTKKYTKKIYLLKIIIFSEKIQLYIKNIPIYKSL